MTITVNCYFVTPEGTPIANAPVYFQPAKSGFVDPLDGIIMPREAMATTDVNGECTIQLWSSPIPYHVLCEDLVSEAAIAYKILVPEPVVPAVEYRLQDLIVDGEISPTYWDTSALTSIYDAKIAALAAAVAADSSAASAGIAGAVVNGSGHLIVTRQDAVAYDAGNVIGPQGPQGPTGPAGSNGTNGTNSQTTTPVLIELCCSDETTALAAGTGKISFRTPHAFTLTAVRASLGVAQTSGAALTVDVNESGTSVLSTKLSFDNTEKTTVSASVPAVISDASIGDDVEITVDIDAVGDGTAKGLKVALIGTRPIVFPAPYELQFACSDEATALTAGTGKIAFRLRQAMTLTGVRASLSTAQVGGSIFTVDINESGTSVLSTKLTIDNGEKTSTTAVTPAVISDTALADDAEITIDIDQVGDGTAKGLKITLIGII